MDLIARAMSLERLMRPSVMASKAAEALQNG